MSARRQQPVAPRRIALVWDTATMRGQRILTGLCRWADTQPAVAIRRFNVRADSLPQSVLRSVRDWKPLGVIVYVDDLEGLRRLRALLPHIPIVSAMRVPATIANTIVVGDAWEVTRVARDHFRAHGVNTVAFFAASYPEAAAILSSRFRSEVPDGPVLAHELTIQKLREEPAGKSMRIVGNWLRSLRQPAGVLTFDDYGAHYLSRVCQRMGLHVPRTIQLIGVDDADACLECTPHLTSVIPPGELVGKTAIETMLQYLTPDAPQPEASVLVQGCTIVARGSTGFVPRRSRAVGQALNLIEADATTGLSATKVVKHARQGRSTFYKEFRTATGTTPARLLRRRRINEACRLLRDSTANITEIAQQCGFSSANYFAGAFRRETGQTPTAYRQRARS